MDEIRPQLVLLDLMLPGADGIELMPGILAIADVPVIFLSAYGHDRVVMTCPPELGPRILRVRPAYS